MSEISPEAKEAAAHLRAPKGVDPSLNAPSAERIIQSAIDKFAEQWIYGKRVSLTHHADGSKTMHYPAMAPVLSQESEVPPVVSYDRPQGWKS